MEKASKRLIGVVVHKTPPAQIVGIVQGAYFGPKRPCLNQHAAAAADFVPDDLRREAGAGVEARLKLLVLILHLDGAATPGPAHVPHS